MLINLSINNIAVIEKANADFSEGFNILTGETGAGKSILIDSLSMVLGMRTSRDLIRHGSDNASVTALFSEGPDLEEFDLENEEDGSIVLSRKLSCDGKNICKINSQTVPLSTLRAVGERLVSIHGQHENISLLKSSYHLSMLDEYAGNAQLASEYNLLYEKATGLKAKLEGMKVSESEREMQKDTLKFRIDEINLVDPREGEDEELSEKRDALKNYSSIMASLEAASEALSAPGAAKDCLYGAMHDMAKAADMDKTLSDFSSQVESIYYSCEDVASEIRSFISRMSFSPYELDEIEERLDKITRLKKKYGPELKDVLENKVKWEEEYGSLLFYEDNMAEAEREAEKAWDEMLKAGEKLHASRCAAAETLAASIKDELSFLEMPKVKFEVEFTAHAPSSDGLYGAEFMLATNPSEEVKPLNKIASGGEMSRIMLALKSALASLGDVGVLLFDEIDSGVSGKAAIKIAQKLKMLSDKRQIICITHLPQMAAKADSHLLIEKDTSTDSFRTKVTALDYEGRVEELTRLIAGDGSTSAARMAAIEMLSE
ncbi:MAG: DNA repair protein RecN [Clostridia bacterium]|nr:DNA repair protein RecN [Clostridia bacterium]